MVISGTMPLLERAAGEVWERKDVVPYSDPLTPALSLGRGNYRAIHEQCLNKLKINADQQDPLLVLWNPFLIFRLNQVSHPFRCQLSFLNPSHRSNLLVVSVVYQT